MPIIRKIVRGDCKNCEREAFCYFGVAFNNFPALTRVVFENDGFTLCSKAQKNGPTESEK